MIHEGVGKRKWQYMTTSIVNELGFKSFKRSQLWVTLVFLVLSVWLSRYVHYLGEWNFLKAQEVPITRLETRPFTMDLVYPRNIALGREVGAILSGTLFCYVWFGVFSVFAFASFRLNGYFPKILYRAIECFGIICVLDPLVTAAEHGLKTLIENDTTGEIYRLYYYFDDRESSGFVGIMMLVLIYIALIGIGSFLFYNYFLYIHMNGRLLDNYMRLNTGPMNIFVPNDCEVSARYLEWVCFKAKNYHSAGGLSRKVVVIKHKFSEPANEVKFSGMHVIIYNIAMDQTRTVHRHFVRLHTGAICELPTRAETVGAYLGDYWGF